MSRALLAVVCSLTMMGCIITREPNYEDPPNFPPSVEDLPTAALPMTATIEWPGEPSTADGGVGGSGGPINLQMIVRDLNVDDPLEWTMWLDYRRDRPLEGFLDGGPLLPKTENNPAERVLETEIDETTLLTLSRGCHRIEVRVSSEFGRLGSTYDPVTPGDVGSGVWWLVNTAGMDAPVDMRFCPRLTP